MLSGREAFQRVAAKYGIAAGSVGGNGPEAGPEALPERIPGKLQDQQRDDAQEYLPDKAAAVLEREVRAGERAGDVAERHDDGELPQQVAVRREIGETRRGWWRR